MLYFFRDSFASLMRYIVSLLFIFMEWLFSWYIVHSCLYSLTNCFHETLYISVEMWCGISVQEHFYTFCLFVWETVLHNFSYTLWYSCLYSWNHCFQNKLYISVPNWCVIFGKEHSYTSTCYVSEKNLHTFPGTLHFSCLYSLTYSFHDTFYISVLIWSGISAQEES